MRWFLSIYLQDREGVMHKRIGEYDSLTKAEIEKDRLLREGYHDRGKNEHHFFPPHSIVKTTIGRRDI
jgi:hypothetical protein